MRCEACGSGDTLCSTGPLVSLCSCNGCGRIWGMFTVPDHHGLPGGIADSDKPIGTVSEVHDDGTVTVKIGAGE